MWNCTFSSLISTYFSEQISATSFLVVLFHYRLNMRGYATRETKKSSYYSCLHRSVYWKSRNVIIPEESWEFNSGLMRFIARQISRGRGCFKCLQRNFKRNNKVKFSKVALIADFFKQDFHWVLKYINKFRWCAVGVFRFRSYDFFLISEKSNKYGFFHSARSAFYSS